MELTCKTCGSKFRAALTLPLTAPVRVACPSCRTQMVLKPATGGGQAPSPVPPSENRRVCVIADEPRPFRTFLGEQLRRLGFDVQFFETGEPALEFIRRTRADLVVVNVYLKGKLGVEVSEEIK